MSSKVEDDDVIVVNGSGSAKDVHVIASSDDSEPSSDESESEISETNLPKESGEHKDEQSEKLTNKDVNTDTVETVDNIEETDNEPLNEILMETSVVPPAICSDVSQNANNVSSLALLATYDTDSDNEENIEMTTTTTEVNNVVEATLNKQLNEGNYRVISDSSSDDESDFVLR